VNVDTGSVPAKVTLTTSDTIVRDVAADTAQAGYGVPQGLLYPYPSTAYAVYADTCASAKPSASSPATSTLIPAGGTAPSATGSVDLQLPSLNVKVTNGATATTKVAVKTACGTIIGPRAIVADGTLKNPGLPYGTGFTVCAVDGTKKAVATSVSNTNYANAPLVTTPTTLALSTTGATCPFTMP
jgi:hypothetical protein